MFGSPSAGLDLRLPGQFNQAETGALSQNWNRDYDTNLGLYIEVDPLGLAAGQNVYGYVDADPLTKIDPYGLTPAGAAVGGRLGAWAGAIIGEAIDPIGGGIPGAEIGSILGAAIGNGVTDDQAAATASTATSSKGCPGGNDPCKGLRRQIAEHKKRLADYKSDPYAHDTHNVLGKGYDHLIIPGRINDLEGQIRNFERQLKDCERKHGLK